LAAPALNCSLIEPLPLAVLRLPARELLPALDRRIDVPRVQCGHLGGWASAAMGHFQTHAVQGTRHKREPSLPFEDVSRLIYWSTPKLVAEIKRGDRAYVWRSNSHLGARGVIAIGIVNHEPTLDFSRFARRDRVHVNGDEGAESSDWKTEILLEQVRWNRAAGMLTADLLRIVIPELTVLNSPRNTVYRVPAEHGSLIEELWNR
jgi:hypothetical protein